MTSQFIPQQHLAARIVCVFKAAAGVIYEIDHREFSAVFTDGTICRGMPVHLLEGREGWTVLDERATGGEVASLLRVAKHAAFEMAEEIKNKKAAFDAEKLKISTTGELAAFLTQGEDQYSGKLAITNIRKELKREFPGIKFAARLPNYGSIYISWTDGPTVGMVEAIVSKYKSGSFNSSEDIYENRPTPFNMIFGGSDYVMTSRELSDPFIDKVIDSLWSLWGDSETEKPTAAVFKSGKLWNKPTRGSDCLQRLISREAYETSAI